MKKTEVRITFMSGKPEITITSWDGPEVQQPCRCDIEPVTQTLTSTSDNAPDEDVDEPIPYSLTAAYLREAAESACNIAEPEPVATGKPKRGRPRKQAEPQAAEPQAAEPQAESQAAEPQDIAALRKEAREALTSVARQRGSAIASRIFRQYAPDGGTLDAVPDSELAGLLAACNDEITPVGQQIDLGRF